MTFRLNRLYHFKTPKFWMNLVKWLIFAVIVIVFNHVNSDIAIISSIMVLMVFLAIYIALYMWRSPGKFSVEHQEIFLWMYLKTYMHGVTINGRHYRFAKYFVTVCNVERIEYKSDADEKVGTFLVYGEIRTQNRSGDYVYPHHHLEVVELIGVESFREAKYQMQKEFPDATFTRL